MRELMVYLLLSADGYFVDSDGKMDWAKDRPDPEYQAFAEKNASGDAVLLFGRVTYEMMASFWPMMKRSSSETISRGVRLPAILAGETSAWTASSAISAVERTGSVMNVSVARRVPVLTGRRRQA